MHRIPWLIVNPRKLQQPLNLTKINTKPKRVSLGSKKHAEVETQFSESQKDEFYSILGCLDDDDNSKPILLSKRKENIKKIAHLHHLSVIEEGSNDSIDSSLRNSHVFSEIKLSNLS